MGSDYAMNPPDPPPVWQQVKALQERYAESVQRLREVNARVQELEREIAAQERTIARLSVQLNGAPFPGEEDENMDALNALAEGEDSFSVPRSNELHTSLPEDESLSSRAQEREARRQASIAWRSKCTCGVKTPQREYHKHGCPRAL